MIKLPSVSNKNVLFINPGWEQASYIDTLYQLGYKIYAVNNNHRSIDPRFKDVLICDYFSVDKIIDFAIQHQVIAVITDQCDYSIYAAAVTSEILGFQGIGIEQALLTTNKLLQRDKIRRSDVDILQPLYSLCLSPENAKKFSNSIGYPVILKPVDSRGSFGVSKVDCESEIDNAFISALSNSPARQVIVEEFIEGVQITIDGYADPIEGINSLALATKVMVNESIQVAIGINYPGDLDKVVYAKALINNQAVAQILGIKFGMIHAEYMIDKNDDIYLIEIANRGGGCFTSTDILKAVTGIDFATKLITDSLGIENHIDYSTVAKNKTSLLFFKIPKEGTLHSVHLSNELKTIDELINYKVMINNKNKITLTNNDANRHGFIIISNDSTSALVDKMLACFKFQMTDGSYVYPVLY
jgi:biotin carboxylase